MARPSRWSEERNANREQANWIVGWLRLNGPASTPVIITALEEEGREVRAHILQRALRKSPFIHQKGHTEGEKGQVSVWEWRVED
ncbi:MAG: hypothetical protein HOK85_01590 [Euryarchaeota archaeon]|nr:hypothetical protein [Euryarchaeota archaeon]